jgi:hypothetical protein
MKKTAENLIGDSTWREMVDWTDRDLLACPVCGKVEEVSGKVHDCKFVLKSDLLKIRDEMEEDEIIYDLIYKQTKDRLDGQSAFIVKKWKVRIDELFNRGRGSNG